MPVSKKWKWKIDIHNPFSIFSEKWETIFVFYFPWKVVSGCSYSIFYFPKITVYTQIYITAVQHVYVKLCKQVKLNNGLMHMMTFVTVFIRRLKNLNVSYSSTTAVCAVQHFVCISLEQFGCIQLFILLTLPHLWFLYLTQKGQGLSSSCDGRLFGHNRHRP